MAEEIGHSGGAERRKNLAHGVSRGISGTRCESPGGRQRISLQYGTSTRGDEWDIRPIKSRPYRPRTVAVPIPKPMAWAKG